MMVYTMMISSLTVLPMPVNKGFVKSSSADGFRRGQRSKLQDRVDQSNLDNSIKTYDRASKGSIGERESFIGPDYAAGESQIGSTSDFDRGMLQINRSRDIVEESKIASSSLDTGAILSNDRKATEIAAIPGFSSVGAFDRDYILHRHLDAANVDHVDQRAVSILTDDERYDRGARNHAASTQSSIMHPGAAQGSSTADFSQTRDRARFVNTIPDAGATSDTRRATHANRDTNHISTINHGDGASVISPFGAGGRSRELEKTRKYQAGIHNGDVQETHDYAAGIEKHLQSDWLKGSESSRGDINGFMGAASGSAARKYDGGYDRSDTLIDLASNANKRSIMESSDFNDQDNVKEVEYKSIIV